jgi:hypothetical protein
MAAMPAKAKRPELVEPRRPDSDAERHPGGPEPVHHHPAKASSRIGTQTARLIIGSSAFWWFVALRWDYALQPDYTWNSMAGLERFDFDATKFVNYENLGFSETREYGNTSPLLTSCDRNHGSTSIGNYSMFGFDHTWSSIAYTVITSVNAKRIGMNDDNQTILNQTVDHKNANQDQQKVKLKGFRFRGAGNESFINGISPNVKGDHDKQRPSSAEVMKERPGTFTSEQPLASTPSGRESKAQRTTFIS